MRAKGARRLGTTAARAARVLGTLGALAFVSHPSGAAAADAPAPEVVGFVNGDSITTAELETAFMEMHRGADAEAMRSFDYQKVVRKVLNDHLILQEAVAMGLDQDDALQKELEKKRQEDAVKYYVRQAFQPTIEIPEDDVTAYFERYYRRLQVRTLFVRTEEEARRMRGLVLAGADMDSLAREVSLDMYKYRGGLQDLKYYADVEIILRENSAGVETGKISGVFPYRQSYGFLRVEERRPADPADRERFESDIRAELTTEARKEAWTAFVAGLEKRYAPVRHDEVWKRILADSAALWGQDFLAGGQDAALSIGDSLRVTEWDLRRTISQEAMAASTRSFDALCEDGLRKAKQDLLLRAGAIEGGFTTRPEVTAGVAALERQRLIESYLQETVVPLISYDAEDVRAYYQGHQDDFRGPDEYQIDRIFVEHRERADEVASRLAAGADFVFLARQFDEGDSLEKHATDWVTLASFPPAVGKALAAADIGESAGPFAVQDGWLLLQVRAHRQGAVRPLMEVDKEVRQILFRQQFDKQLDEHLAVLRENSSISLREDRIAAFFGKS